MLLYLYLDGTKMITFLLACLYVLCQMPATDTAGIALFSTPTPPSLSCSFLVEVNSFCNSSDSPVTVRRGSRVSEKKKKKKKKKADDESLDKSAASRRLPGFIVVLTEAAERKRPIESLGERRETLVVLFVCFTLLNVIMDQLKNV